MPIEYEGAGSIVECAADWRAVRLDDDKVSEPACRSDTRERGGPQFVVAIETNHWLSGASDVEPQRRRSNPGRSVLRNTIARGFVDPTRHHCAIRDARDSAGAEPLYQICRDRT